LLSFLQSLHDQNLSYSCINAARSAVAFLSQPNNPVGDTLLIKRFIKGVSKINPPRPKYEDIWDPGPVIDYLRSLEPIEDLSFENLTLKTIGLLALATAHRSQTYAAIEIADLNESTDQMEIRISSHIKTSRPNLNQPCLVLPMMKDDVKVCVARCIKHYCEESKKLRHLKCTKLFISPNKHHMSVSASTISRWIRTVLQKGGIDTEKFKSHSTRHAATSSAARKGIPVDQIRARAGWTNRSCVFAKFYNKPIDNRSDFARAILST